MLIISKNLKFVVIFITFFCFNTELFCQSKLQYKADELSGTESELGPIREYIGNVEITQDDIRIKCGYARQIINTNTAILKNNVVVYQGNMIMKSEEMSYDGNMKIAKSLKPIEIIDNGTYVNASRGTYFVNDKKADFVGNVIVENDTTLILSDQIQYYRTSGVSIAKGNANIKIKKENSLIIGDIVENFPTNRYSIIKGNANLIQIDTLIKNDIIFYDTLKIVCDTVESFREGDEIYNFISNVVIKKEAVFAQSGFASYNKTKSSIVFNKNPLVWYDKFQLYADSILLKLNDKHLESIKAYNNALSVNKDTLYNDRFNQISGNYIEILFENDKISRINSTGDSKSLYFLNNEGEAEGADRKNTDKIEIIFNNGEAENIYWIGKTSGYYIPESILSTSISKYNLNNLKWLEEIPKINLRKSRISK